LPPTLYCFIAFNPDRFHDQSGLATITGSFVRLLVATTTALVVGKSVLVANQIRLIDPLSRRAARSSILYKTIFYTLIVLVRCAS